jgi:hypothetical protein
LHPFTGVAQVHFFGCMKMTLFQPCPDLSILKSHFFKYQWILNWLFKFHLPISCWINDLS